MPRGILITGASSGIGAGLAQAYAAPDIHLFLSGRDQARLEAEADSCRQGATVEARSLDVADRAAMAHWIEAAEAARPLDLVIANAGVSLEKGDMDLEAAARQVLSINLDGAFNTVFPALAAMRARRRGQIALIASLAGFRGFSVAPAYCASKAALRVWGEGMRVRLAGDGIGLTVVCPGFVKSGMTEGNRFPMPFLMESEPAIRLIRRGIDANRARVSFPWPMAAATWLLAALPPAWSDRLIAARTGHAERAPGA